MAKNKHKVHSRPMRFPPRSASAAKRVARRLAPDQFALQQAVTVGDLVEEKILAVNGKGEVYYAGE